MRLSTMIRGVDFTFIEDGEPVRAWISGDLLMATYGAQKEPASWLQAFDHHRSAIECAASLQHRANPSPRFVILTRQRRTLRQKASAGPAG
jgi:hypothetical protein